MREDDGARRVGRSVGLVFCCTLFGAAAQILMKTGANHLAQPGLGAIVTNLPLLAGYCLYGISTVLLVAALRNGQLSILYPVISLTYVWVTVLSVMIFRESLNLYKLTGISIIVLGVAVLGRDGKR
jgi:multidrug transporter EmrE-like cation transporter